MKSSVWYFSVIFAVTLLSLVNSSPAPADSTAGGDLAARFAKFDITTKAQTAQDMKDLAAQLCPPCINGKDAQKIVDVTNRFEKEFFNIKIKGAGDPATKAAIVCQKITNKVVKNFCQKVAIENDPSKKGRDTKEYETKVGVNSKLAETACQNVDRTKFVTTGDQFTPSACAGDLRKKK